MPEALRQTDGGRGLALARLGRRDAGDANDLPVRLIRQAVDHVQRDLRLVAPVRLELFRRQARPLRDRFNRKEFGLLRDLETRLHRSPSSVAHRGRGELGYELVLIEPLELE